MRWPQVGADRSDTPCEDDVSGGECVWELKYPLLDVLAVVLDRVAHIVSITKMLLPGKLGGEGAPTQAATNGKRGGKLPGGNTAVQSPSLSFSAATRYAAKNIP